MAGALRDIRHQQRGFVFQRPTVSDGTALASASEGRRRHARHEDALAILIGALLVSLGVLIYSKAMFLVGGIAGLSLLLGYVTPLGFWLSFFVLNLPFYGLAWRRKGRGFVIRTLLAVSLECLLTYRGGH